MNIQAKVALDKQAHPERYCKEPRCLWKVVESTMLLGQPYFPLKGSCPNGRCPRHQPKIRNLALGIAQGLNNQTHKEKP